MSAGALHRSDLADPALLNRPEVELLGPQQERAMLVELGECKRLLLEARPASPCEQGPESAEGPDIRDVVRDLLDPATAWTAEARHLVPIAARYHELRAGLAMANLRLVAHLSRRYRDRGLATSDLLQEGFCGLLTAIDRFDATREARLATYAAWWIRQALQRAVAAGAYPVRLDPRHLRQLAKGRADVARPREPGRGPSSKVGEATIRQIYSATRRVVSLEADLHVDERSSLLGESTDPAYEAAQAAELGESLVALIRRLQPREQVVLRLRFGLDGQPCHSLSQVGERLEVSKERIRQIQQAALAKLRGLAEDGLDCEAAG
jgi:RNA polymerase primary sigma factor